VIDEGRDQFEKFLVNPVKQVADEPVSTFSADVDTASYSFVRRQLNSGRLPQKDSVRVEEMINYFDYAWPAASSAKAPFKPTVVVSDSPWGKGRKLSYASWGNGSSGHLLGHLFAQRTGLDGTHIAYKGGAAA
jgi:Ca-activated chloride channel family protein